MGALPITFNLTPVLDGVTLASNNIVVSSTAPVAPGDGDTWLDTSGTDMNLGNASGDSIVPITNSYVQKRWKTSWNKWVYVSRGGGQLGTRVTIPVPFQAYPATRMEFILTCSSAERIQIEGIALEASHTA